MTGATFCGRWILAMKGSGRMEWSGVEGSDGKVKRSSLWWSFLPGEFAKLVLHLVFEVVERRWARTWQ